MERIAAEGEEVAIDVAGIPALGLDPPHRGGDLFALTSQDRMKQLLIDGQIGATEDSADLFIDDLAAAKGGDLIEQSDTVANAALGGASDQTAGRGRWPRVPPLRH